MFLSLQKRASFYLIGGCLLLFSCGSMPQGGMETTVKSGGDATVESKQQQSSVETQEAGDIQTHAYQLDAERRKLEETLAAQRLIYQSSLGLVIVGFILIAGNTDRWFPVWLMPAVWIASLACVIGAFALPLVYNLL
jgi:hypothetical protein